MRKIEPFLPRSISLDNVLGQQQVVGSQVEVAVDVTEDQVVDETVDDNQLRRSTRVRQSPDRYEAA